MHRRCTGVECCFEVSTQKESERMTHTKESELIGFLQGVNLWFFSPV